MSKYKSRKIDKPTAPGPTQAPISKQPQMEFEKITEFVIRKGLYKEKPKATKQVVEQEMTCPNCEKTFTFIVRGPRSAYGRCTCGFVMMS